MRFVPNKTRNMRPINILVLYNFATLLLFLFSAWNYRVTNYGLVILVVVVNLLSLYFGYLAAINSHKNHTPDEYSLESNKRTDEIVIKLLYKWTIISAIIALPDMLYYSRMWTMSPSQILQRLVIGLTESNLNYSLSLGYENSGTTLEKIVVLITVLLYFLKFAVVPLSVIYWKRVSKKQKILCVYIVIVDVIKWLLKGMNKGVFDYVFVLFASALLVMAYNGKRNKGDSREKNTRPKKQKWIILLVLLVIIMAVNLFVSNIAARSSRLTKSYFSSSMQLTADPDNIILKLFPSGMHNAILSLEMYMTCGYQGLSYALRLPFRWCFGIGNNQFTISNFRDALGINVSALTYQARVEQSFPWYEFHNWHTTYTWLANDFSFYLLPVVFFILGYIFALSWLSSIKKHNPYATIVFCLFTIRIAYLPANNIVLSSSFTFIAWWVSMVLWYLSSHGIGIRFGRIRIFNQKF